MSVDYWKSPEGIKRRVSMLGEDYTFHTVNNALQVYGERNGVTGYQWVGTPDERICAYCDSQIGRIYRRGQFLPSLPAHAGCRCEWELLPEIEVPPAYAAKISLHTVPEKERPTKIKAYIRSITQRTGVIVDKRVFAFEEATIHNTKIQIINNPDPEYRKILLDTLETIPPEHLQGIPHIRLISRGENNHISGVINNETRTITLYDGYVQFDKTVYHEVGHNIYQNLLNEDDKREWDEIWYVAAENTRKMTSYDLPSDYATMNSDEGFAECYAYISKYQSYKGPGGVPIVAKNIFDWVKTKGF